MAETTTTVTSLYLRNPRVEPVRIRVYPRRRRTSARLAPSRPIAVGSDLTYADFLLIGDQARIAV